MAAILVIEDEALLAKSIARTLRRQGHRVETGGDGDSALRLWREFQPDLMLLDLNMSKVDGREVLRQMREDPELRQTVVIVLTTSRQEEDIVRTYDLGVNSFITKPLDLAQFFRVVKTLEEYWFQVVRLPPTS